MPGSLPGRCEVPVPRERVTCACRRSVNVLRRPRRRPCAAFSPGSASSCSSRTSSGTRRPPASRPRKPARPGRRKPARNRSRRSSRPRHRHTPAVGLVSPSASSVPTAPAAAVGARDFDKTGNVRLLTSEKPERTTGAEVEPRRPGGPGGRGSTKTPNRAAAANYRAVDRALRARLRNSTRRPALSVYEQRTRPPRRQAMFERRIKAEARTPTPGEAEAAAKMERTKGNTNKTEKRRPRARPSGP